VVDDHKSTLLDLSHASLHEDFLQGFLLAAAHLEMMRIYFHARFGFFLFTFVSPRVGIKGIPIQGQQLKIGPCIKLFVPLRAFVPRETFRPCEILNGA
jgi:hypothetical protein